MEGPYVAVFDALQVERNIGTRNKAGENCERREKK